MDKNNCYEFSQLSSILSHGLLRLINSDFYLVRYQAPSTVTVKDTELYTKMLYAHRVSPILAHSYVTDFTAPRINQLDLP
jgi:hypothetical protein